MKIFIPVALVAAFSLAGCGTVEGGLDWLGNAKEVGREKAIEGTIVGAENYCGTFSEAARKDNRAEADARARDRAGGADSVLVRVGCPGDSDYGNF